MDLPYDEIRGFVEQLTPTWRGVQQENFAQLVAAMMDRGSLNESDLARKIPRWDQKLHGRLKRLGRFLDNPRLDESALSVRWLKLAYHFGNDLPQPAGERPIVPLLFDTVYFDPFAMLVTSVPCGSRGLPVALTSYHRTKLTACFPPQESWRRVSEELFPPRPRRGHSVLPASAVVSEFLSQNKIEEELIDRVFALLSPALRGVTVADRGFARASFFEHHYERQRDFAIRFDAETHIGLPKPLASDRPSQGPPGDVLGLRPGQSRWCPEAWYGEESRVPIKVLGLWDVGYKDPWYIATNLASPEVTELLYRWRMRLECANRDEKTGVILREGGDQHALTSVLHLHRLLLALCTAEWLCALTGLQAARDLPNGSPPTCSATPAPSLPEPSGPAPLEMPTMTEPMASPGATAGGTLATAEDPTRTATSRPEKQIEPHEEGPSLPPPVIPHRGERPKLPDWMKLFAARGPLSYVRLGMEILRTLPFIEIPHRMVRWLADYLRPWTPPWRHWQRRYRLHHWHCWIHSS